MKHRWFDALPYKTGTDMATMFDEDPREQHLNRRLSTYRNRVVDAAKPIGINVGELMPKEIKAVDDYLNDEVRFVYLVYIHENARNEMPQKWMGKLAMLDAAYSPENTILNPVKLKGLGEVYTGEEYELSRNIIITHTHKVYEIYMWEDEVEDLIIHLREQAREGKP